MKIFRAIGDFFQNVFFPKLKSFFSAVFTKSVQMMLAEIKDVVRNVVSEISVEDLTNAEKRNEAYKRIVAELKASGKTVKESIIRLAIEMAVTELKNVMEN